MPRFAAGAKTTAGSTLLPMISIFSSATNQANVREIGVFNTTTTPFDIRLARISSGPGTVGAALTKTPVDNPLAVAGALAYTTHTTGGTPTLADAGYRASIGAAIGAGIIWTFGGEGFEIAAAAGTANGLCVVVENGTGQIAQSYIVWDE